MDHYQKTMLRLSKRRISVRRDGQSEDISVLEALALKQQEVALKGGSMALRDAVAAIRRTAQEASEEAEHQYEFWSRIHGVQLGKLRQAQAEGRSTVDILPHPDDIVFGGPEGAKLIGPFDPESAAAAAKIVGVRDTLYLQAVLEDRIATNSGTKDHPPTTALFLATLINQALPPSLRLSENGELQSYMSAGRRMTKRQLMTACREAWSRFGIRIRCGRLMPELDDVRNLMDITFSLSAATIDADGDRSAQRRALQAAMDRIADEFRNGLRRKPDTATNPLRGS